MKVDFGGGGSAAYVMQPLAVVIDKVCQKMRGRVINRDVGLGTSAVIYFQFCFYSGIVISVIS